MIRFLQTPGPIKKFVLGGILVVICVSMAWYVLPGGGGTSVFGSNTPQKGVVASVAGEDVTTLEVQKQARQMVQQQFPRGGAQANMLMPFFAQRAADNLINEKVMLSEANRMGLQVSEAEVREELEHGPYAATFFPGGKFIGEEEYKNLLGSHDLTPPQFEHLVGNGILERKLEKLIASSATVTDAEVRQQFEKENTKVKFDYAVIKKDDILKSLHPAEAELKAFYDRNKQTYVNSIPEKRQLKYVVLDNTKMLAQTQVTQQDLASYYDQHRDEYRVPEQVNVHHILFKTPPPGQHGKVDQKAVDAARAKAEDVLKQAKAAGNYDGAANTLKLTSTCCVTGQDTLPGISSDTQFMTAAFGQAPNSPPDQAQLHQGLAIYQLTAVKPPATPTFEEIRSRVEQEFKNERAAQLLTQRTQELADRAKVDHDLKKAAKESGAEFKTSDFVLPDAQVPDLGWLTG